MPGYGIGVAVIDSGIEPGTDFDNRITAFYDFTGGDIRAVTPMTSTAMGRTSRVSSAASSSVWRRMSRLIGLKVLDARGQGTTDNVVRAIEFAITNRHLLGINMLNLSLGHPIFEHAATDPLVQAVEHAARVGSDGRRGGRQLRRESEEQERPGTPASSRRRTRHRR